MLQKQTEANILSRLHSHWMGILYWKQSAPSHLAMICTIKHQQLELTKHYQSALWHMCVFHHFYAHSIQNVHDAYGRQQSSWLLIKQLSLDLFAKLWRVTISFTMSAHLYETIRLPLVEFSENFVFEYFSKISHGNSSFKAMWQA
jgi:hypothetical protein